MFDQLSTLNLRINSPFPLLSLSLCSFSFCVFRAARLALLRLLIFLSRASWLSISGSFFFLSFAFIFFVFLPLSVCFISAFSCLFLCFFVFFCPALLLFFCAVLVLSFVFVFFCLALSLFFCVVRWSSVYIGVFRLARWHSDRKWPIR